MSEESLINIISQKHSANIELHTHFMSVMNESEFLNTIKMIIVALNKKGISVSLDNDFLYDAQNLVLKTKASETEQERWRKLIDIYGNRTALLASIIKTYDYLPKEEQEQYNEIVYKIMLKNTIQSLINQDIKYVEMSYANFQWVVKCMDFINNDKFFKDVKNKITCKFLLAEDRIRNFSKFKKQLEKIANYTGDYKNLPIGVDIMGEETSLSTNLPKNADKKTGTPTYVSQKVYFAENSQEPGYQSMKQKIFLILDTLMQDEEKYKYCYKLRIHAGEFIDTEENLGTILEYINDYYITKIESVLGIPIINPDFKSNPQIEVKRVDFRTVVIDKNNPLNQIIFPEIRLGHAIRFKNVKKSKIKTLLTNLNCIVEFNPISNLKLGKIKSVDEIPVEYYQKNNTPCVVSTDGGGIYGNTYKQSLSSFKNAEQKASFDKTMIEYLKVN